MSPSQASAAARPFGLVAALLAGLTSCGDSEAAELTPEVVIARDRAAEFFAREQWADARATLAPLVAARNAAAEDLLRAANVELAEEHAETARPLIERARELDAENPVLLWADYRVAAHGGDYEGALAKLEALRKLLPDDLTVRLAYADMLGQLERPEESERELRALEALPPELSVAWRMTIVYKLAQLLQQTNRYEEATPFFDEYKRLENRGLKAPGVPSRQPGTLGALRPHTPTLFATKKPAAPGADLVQRVIGTPRGARGFALARLGWGASPVDLGLERGVAKDEIWQWKPDPPGLVVWGDGGVELHRRAPDGTWKAEHLHDSPATDILPFDRMNAGARPSDVTRDEWRTGDQELDLIVALIDSRGVVPRLLENASGTWSLHEDALATPAFPDRDWPAGSLAGGERMTAVDYDHDGDVDLLLTPVNGPLLLRNDGLDTDVKAVSDATAEARLPRGDFRAMAEDFDNDNDVDLLLVERASGRPHLASNERAGRFSDATASLPAGIQGTYLVVADLDGDAWTDLAVFGQDLALHCRTELGGWRSEVRRFPLAVPPVGMPRAVDWDLDGTLDLVWPSASSPAAGILAPAFAEGGVAFELGPRFPEPRQGPASIAVDDLDGDCDHDLVRLDAEGLQEFSTAGGGRGVGIGLMGFKDNARGNGAIVEARAGLRYSRFYYRGERELVGFGGARLDVVRVSWPNGIVQSFFDVDPASDVLFWQRRGLLGSCPFLYTWNGRTYEFVSDVLGITPLGLPMAPGRPGEPPILVPPDHDEHVLVKGEQLAPKDGFYELQLTEELREVTYLDRIRLDVVDHPADVEVFPNERFTFPPFPEAHTHTVREALAPFAARGPDGKDWKDELARDDLSFAVPFRELLDQFHGLAEPYTIELAFDAARVKAAPRLRLLMNGWLVWTDASVNMAAGHHPEHEFVPPLLQVPGDGGEWTDAGVLGFPAGKLKTMVVDVTDALDRDDPRLRIFSTLRIHWDSIRLAVDADDAPLVTTAIEPASALLWERGFSAPDPARSQHGLEWFRWDALEPGPRWNQHPGLYTRHGETLPLVTSIDDCFVILGAGDCLTVRFDASLAPPLPDGWQRDFLVFLDGWAKDRDPNTLEALYVEPLPFHGMSGYPYRPDERYPDDEAHRAYRREWNTRPARRWIEPLVPPAPPALSPTTSQMPAKSSAPATQAGSAGLSPSTSAPAAPATSG